CGAAHPAPTRSRDAKSINGVPGRPVMMRSLVPLRNRRSTFLPARASTLCRRAPASARGVLLDGRADQVPQSGGRDHVQFGAVMVALREKPPQVRVLLRL